MQKKAILVQQIKNGIGPINCFNVFNGDVLKLNKIIEQFYIFYVLYVSWCKGL